MTAEYTIRLATLDDVPTIVYHRIAMFTDMGTDPEVLRRMKPPFIPWVSERIANGEYIGLLAVTPSGQVAAGAGLWLNQWLPGATTPTGLRGYILNVYTEREHRRQGLARRLVQECIDKCKEHGLSTVVLHASDQGRPIYEGLGFKVTNEMRLFVEP